MASRKSPDLLTLPQGLSLLGLVALMGAAAADLKAIYWAPLPRSAVPVTLALVVPCGLFLALLWVGFWRPSVAERVRALRPKLDSLTWLLALLPAAAFAYLIIYTRWGRIYTGAGLRAFLAVGVIGGMAWLISRAKPYPLSWRGLLAAVILFGSLFTLATALQNSVSYPFSLGWSEGNRFYDYSLLYGRGRYIYPADLPLKAYIDRGRQSLWGLPFMLPGFNIQQMRLWDALMFSVPYALFGWMVFRPRKGQMAAGLIAGLAVYLFLQQGPIYSPLVLAAILVAGAVHAPLLVGLLLTGLAGYYAQLSRNTWLFAPAIWAGVWAFVAYQPASGSSLVRRWGRAAALGAAGLVGGYAAPILVKLLRFDQVKTGLASVEGITMAVGRQPLLWDRLLPNSTYAPGILLGLLLAAGPLVALLIYLVVSRRWALDLWAKLALGGSLLAFLAVGLVASIKIGGGSNLHNLDMFLIGLVFAAGLAWENGAGSWLVRRRPPWLAAGLILFTLLYPVKDSLFTAQPISLPPAEDVQEALTTVQKMSAEARQQGDVLFIDQRQLLTFGYIRDVPLVSQYEKKLMMDEAMSGDQAYFDKFYKDLTAHRFSLIVSEPLRVDYQGGTFDFGNENDAWVKWVSEPVLCFYQPVETFTPVQMQLLVPRTSPDPSLVNCPR